MAEIFDKFFKFQKEAYAGVEDFSDRLNFQVTVILLLACCTTITLKTYVLSPVACYIPNEVGAHSGQEQFVNNYCWTEGTYAVPVAEFSIDNTLPNPLEKYEDRKIVYYQWVPFVLGLQALMFYMPKVLWGMMSYNRAGTDVGHIIQTTNEAVTAEAEKHTKLVQHAGKRLQQMLFQNEHLDNKKEKRLRPSKRQLSFTERIQLFLHNHLKLPTRRFGYWLIFNYFVIKAFYIVNAVGQLCLMHSFLGFNSTYFVYGAAVLHHLRQGRDWTQTMIFPRVGSCAVYYRGAAGGNYVYSQCTLPINMINEKIYVFLWFWILGIALVTIASVPVWIFRLMRLKRRAKFIKCYLTMSEACASIDKRDVNRFIRDFLSYDGIFLLKMIALNSGDVVCSEVVQDLWMFYRNTHTQYGEDAIKRETCATNSGDQIAIPALVVPSAPLAPLAEFEKSPVMLQRHVSQPEGDATRQRLIAVANNGGGTASSIDGKRALSVEAGF